MSGLVAARLYRPWRERPPAFVSAFHYAPWLVANLHLDRSQSPRPAPLAWDNVLYDSAGSGTSWPAAVAAHAYGRHRADHYRPFPGGRRPRPAGRS